MFSPFAKARSRFWRYVGRQITNEFVFNEGIRERRSRQAFFYDAFKALSFNGMDGDYAEFGCWGGMTFALAFHEARRHGYTMRSWAFDSFAGLPAPTGQKDDHPVWKVAALSTSLAVFYELCDANKLPREAYETVPGFYNETLVETNAAHLPGNIALAYIDCDLYSSTKTVLEFLMPRLKHGMIIAFDDYFCWSKTQLSGERRAALEMFAKHERWELVPYHHFGWHGNSFVVEDKRIVGS